MTPKMQPGTRVEAGCQIGPDINPTDRGTVIRWDGPMCVVRFDNGLEHGFDMRDSPTNPKRIGYLP